MHLCLTLIQVVVIESHGSNTLLGPPKRIRCVCQVCMCMGGEGGEGRPSERLCVCVFHNLLQN